VCVTGYASSVRDVPESESEQVYASGPNPTRADGAPAPRMGSRTGSHDLVCSGVITLAYAQRIEAHNWGRRLSPLRRPAVCGIRLKRIRWVRQRRRKRREQRQLHPRRLAVPRRSWRSRLWLRRRQRKRPLLHRAGRHVHGLGLRPIRSRHERRRARLWIRLAAGCAERLARPR
jgi:hypothetical protein